MSNKEAALRELNYAVDEGIAIINSIPENEEIGFGIFITRVTEQSTTGNVRKFTFGDIHSMLLRVMSLLDTALEKVPENYKMLVLNDIMFQMRESMKNHATIPS